MKVNLNNCQIFLRVEMLQNVRKFLSSAKSPEQLEYFEQLEKQNKRLQFESLIVSVENQPESSQAFVVEPVLCRKAIQINTRRWQVGQCSQELYQQLAKDVGENAKIILHNVNVVFYSFGGSNTQCLKVKLAGFENSPMRSSEITLESITSRRMTLFNSEIATEYASLFGSIDQYNIDAVLVERASVNKYKFNSKESRAARHIADNYMLYQKRFNSIRRDDYDGDVFIGVDDWEQGLRRELLENIINNFVFASAREFSVRLKLENDENVEQNIDFELEFIYTIMPAN